MLNRFGALGSNGQRDAEIEDDNFPIATDTGTMLRERREAMGVSLAEVEAATRIRQKYLSALESNDWHLLPGEIVGRGFLRNYAAYLNLDPNETLSRRRSVIEPRMAAALARTSAGAQLPPDRQVDYRPKEVDLKDEDDQQERRPLRLRPILGVLLAAVLLFLLIQNIGQIVSAAGSAASRTQAAVADLMQPPEATATPDTSMAITAAPIFSSGGISPTAQLETPLPGSSAATEPQAAVPTVELGPTPTERTMTISEMMTQQASAPDEADEPSPTPETLGADAPEAAPGVVDPGVAEPGVVEEPTPTIVSPTEIPTVEPPTPTEEPTPEPVAPVVQAAFCPDSRAVISSPGSNQIIAGVTSILGTATHEAFQNYKLEYAPGASASGGFAYFDGANNPVVGGSLGSLNTGALANGTYTIQLTVVDQTGNFPAPCQVTVTIQN